MGGELVLLEIRSSGRDDSTGNTECCCALAAWSLWKIRTGRSLPLPPKGSERKAMATGAADKSET